MAPNFLVLETSFGRKLFSVDGVGGDGFILQPRSLTCADSR